VKQAPVLKKKKEKAKNKEKNPPPAQNPHGLKRRDREEPERMRQTKGKLSTLSKHR